MEKGFEEQVCSYGTAGWAGGNCGVSEAVPTSQADSWQGHTLMYLQGLSKSTPLAGFLLLKPGLMRDSPGHRLLTPSPGPPL